MEPNIDLGALVEETLRQIRGPASSRSFRPSRCRQRTPVAGGGTESTADFADILGSVPENGCNLRNLRNLWIYRTSIRLSLVSVMEGGTWNGVSGSGCWRLSGPRRID